MIRLDFAVPRFQRHTWVNDRAASTWEQRFDDIKMALYQVSIASVAQAQRAAGMVALPQDRVAEWTTQLEAKGLQAQAVGTQPWANAGVSLTLVQLGFARSHAVLTQLAEAMADEDPLAVGKLLGYPTCCTHAYAQWQEANALADPAWWIAQATNDLATQQTTQYEGVKVSTDHLPGCNLLYHRMGLQPTFHLPCSLKCTATQDHYEAVLALGARIGFATEMEWLQEIMGWSAAWSMLHGIAELKTPVLKSVHNAPTTAHKYGVHIQGANEPLFHETGIRFPYRSLKKRKVTESVSFQQGLAQVPENPVKS